MVKKIFTLLAGATINAAAKDKMCDYHFNMIYHYIYKYFEDLCNHNSWKHSRSNTSFLHQGRLHHIIIQQWCSYSGDLILYEFNYRITIDNVSGNKRKNIWFEFIHLVNTQSFPKKTDNFCPLINTRTCAYQRVQKVSFSKTFVRAEWMIHWVQ